MNRTGLLKIAAISTISNCLAGIYNFTNIHENSCLRESGIGVLKEKHLFALNLLIQSDALFVANFEVKNGLCIKDISAGYGW